MGSNNRIERSLEDLRGSDWVRGAKQAAEKYQNELRLVKEIHLKQVENKEN